MWHGLGEMMNAVYRFVGFYFVLGFMKCMIFLKKLKLLLKKCIDT